MSGGAANNPGIRAEDQADTDQQSKGLVRNLETTQTPRRARDLSLRSQCIPRASPLHQVRAPHRVHLVDFASLLIFHMLHSTSSSDKCHTSNSPSYIFQADAKT